MLRLLRVIIFTADMPRARAFYETQVGLTPTFASDHWTTFDTAGTNLALHPLPPGRPAGVELAFESEDLYADVDALERRGARFQDAVNEAEWGRTIHLHDPEGNLITLEQLAEPLGDGGGLAIGTVVVHAAELESTGKFYRDVLGLPFRAAALSGHLELDAGGTRLALEPGEGRRRGQTVSFRFDVDHLGDWIDEARERGLPVGNPFDRGAGAMALAVDPDGNEIAFHQAAEGDGLEEEMADPFESDAVPRRSAIRKPVRKRSKAVSRVAIKATHSPKRSTARRRPSATTRAVASVRGAGPAGTRLKPRRTGDEKKARVKPAIGRLRKAESRTLQTSKRAAASASKRRPVKRQVAKRSGRR